MHDQGYSGHTGEVTVDTWMRLQWIHELEGYSGYLSEVIVDTKTNEIWKIEI